MSVCQSHCGDVAGFLCQLSGPCSDQSSRDDSIWGNGGDTQKGV